MALVKEQRILYSFKNNPNIRCVRVITTSSNFEKRYEGSINYFFKSLKNSLQSVNGVSNREFFRNLSGAYFSMDDSEAYDIIILYDISMTNPSELQWRIRLKKLLGSQITIEFGNFSTFADRLDHMAGIVRKAQLFGDYYSSSNLRN